MERYWDTFISERGAVLNDMSLRETLRQFYGWLEEQGRIARAPAEQEHGPAWLLTWLESEAGWGVRPDGGSLHRTREAAEAFVKAYWDRMPSREELGGGVPDEYSRPTGPGRPVLVDADLRRALAEAEDPNGMWIGRRDLGAWEREGRIREPP